MSETTNDDDPRDSAMADLDPPESLTEPEPADPCRVACERLLQITGSTGGDKAVLAEFRNRMLIATATPNPLPALVEALERLVRLNESHFDRQAKKDEAIREECVRARAALANLREGGGA